MSDTSPLSLRATLACGPTGLARLSALVDECDLELVRLCLDNGFHAFAAAWSLSASAPQANRLP
jgi:hypothetical protein